MGGWLSRAPAPPLDAFIDRLWTSERSAGLAHAREWNLPTGRADLVLPLDRADLHRYTGPADLHGHWLAGGVLQGAMLTPTLRDTSAAAIVVGAHFKPGGLAGLLRGPADQITGQGVALDALWPGWAAMLREQVATSGALHDPQRRLQCLEHALRARWLRPQPPDAMVAWALVRLQAGAAIGTLQRESGLSATTFIRRFRAVCGLSPMQHRGLQRFQAALAAGHTGLGWAEAAHDSGYADQAHLGREFRRLARHTPGQVRAGSTGWAQHLACR